MEWLDDQQFHGALSEMLSDESTLSKLSWWLGSGHSIERWVQFELAYLLDRRFKRKFATVCESKRVDISVYSTEAIPPEGIWTNEAVADIELKVRANWYAANPGYTFDKIVEDITKTKECRRPAVAIVVWFFVDVEPENALAAWIDQLIKKKVGVQKFGDLSSKLESSKVDVKLLGAPIQSRVPGCREFTTYLLGYKNELAR